MALSRTTHFLDQPLRLSPLPTDPVQEAVPRAGNRHRRQARQELASRQAPVHPVPMQESAVYRNRTQPRSTLATLAESYVDCYLGPHIEIDFLRVCTSVSPVASTL